MLGVAIAGCQSLSLAPSPSPTPLPTATAIAPKTVLEKVKERETLICGVANDLPGFSTVDAQGKWQGFNVDFCRAIAAAVLGNGDAVKYEAVPAVERFTALQSGTVDVLIHNTTWTLSRDTENAIAFTTPLFYDGQGIMARTLSSPASPSPATSSATPATPTRRSVTRLADLGRDRLCVEAGASQTRLERALERANVTPRLVVRSTQAAVLSAYERGECDALSLDRSQLAMWRSRQPRPDDHAILADTWSQEPLSAATTGRDERWFDIVNWTIFATMQAEALGLTQQNYTTFANTKDAEISRFVGTTEALGIKLGLAPDWTTQVLKTVGNYGEIYQRHLQPLGLSRGVNRLWREGGLLYPMPFR